TMRPMSAARKRILPGVDRALAELEPDTQELVVLGDAIRARQAPRLDLPRVRGDSEVGNERVLRLAGPVADDGPVVIARRQADAVQRLGERADLVEFDEDGVGDLGLDATLQALDAGDE